ncbi:MAG: PAS domain S-box protein, partial [Actinomycetota bacterium]
MANDRELVKVHARAFQGTSDLAAVSTPSEGRLLDVNESFVRITGYDRDELIGRATDELGLWVDPEQRRRILTQLQHAASVTGVDVALRAKDGTIRDLRGSAELVEAGDDQYVLTIAKDLSEEVARRSELSGTRRTVRSLTEERRRLSARHDLAVREERARISRELHDSTLQNLAAARLRFYLLEEALGAVNRAELERLEEAIE